MPSPGPRGGKGTVAIALGGGVALGAYEAGAYAALHEAGMRPAWLAGGSIGAVTAAIIAGNAIEDRIGRLRQFWDEAATETFAPAAEGLWRHAHNWASVLKTRIVGQTGLFWPRALSLDAQPDPSVYDLTPMGEKLTRLVDFERLNAGEVRLSVATTDILTGEPVIFDTARGDRIGPDHLLASCGFLPDFAPIEIGGRVLGDAALNANLPLDPILLEGGGDDLVCFVIDLFSPQGERPRSLEGAAARRMDLILANQGARSLEAHRREYQLRAAIARLSTHVPPELRGDPELAALLAKGAERATTVLLLRYRPQADEAGPEKQFDFSRTTLADRWAAGARDMNAALHILEGSRPAQGLTVHAV